MCCLSLKCGKAIAIAALSLPLALHCDNLLYETVAFLRQTCKKLYEVVQDCYNVVSANNKMFVVVI